MYKPEVQMKEEDLLCHPTVRRRAWLGSSPRKPPGDALTKQLVRDEYLEALQMQKAQQQVLVSCSETPPCVWHSS